MKNQKIQCLECKKYFKRLGGGHLEKIHKMSMWEYLKKYPDARTSSLGFIESQKKIQKKLFQNEKLGLRKKVGSRTFDFIKNKDLKKILQRDFAIAKKCLDFGLWKPCIILFSAIIEAVLKEMTGAKTFEKAADAALSKKIIKKDQYHEIHFIRNLRNYVHLHKELKEKIKISDHLAKTLAEICKLIIQYFKK